MNAIKINNRYYDTSYIEREAKGYFFSKDTLRFFNSRVLSDVYEGLGGVYFVTSERFPGFKRLYTVRKYCTETKMVHTVKDCFQISKYLAIKTAKILANGRHL